jgi:hypothetical protein
MDPALQSTSPAAPKGKSIGRLTCKLERFYPEILAVPVQDWYNRLHDF